MAKQVNLGKQQRIAAPAATGSFGAPKPAAIPQPRTNQMPFQTGAIIREFKPTPAEQAVLEQFNWKPGDPVPENFADIMSADLIVKDSIAAKRAEAIKAAYENLPLPVPANTPPLAVPREQSIDSLTPDKQEEILAALRDAKRIERDQNRIREMQMQNAPPGVNEAIAAATAPSKLVDDRQAETYAGTDVPKRQSITGAALQRTHCDHCGHELNTPTIEVSDEDKFVFVQSVLGGVPFSKTVRAFNDQLLITARTLSVAEVDLCHKQAYIEKDLGEIVTPFDVTETVLRYRLCLQLQQIRGAGMDFDLPDSVDGWSKSLDDAGVDPAAKGHTPLRRIKEWLDENVFRTETMIRLISVITADLNRLTAKLEANYLNSDFWKGTVA